MIAIHERPGSFSDRWIEYCEKNGIEYRIVNCYDNDIINQLRGCNGLMWHWSHNDYRAQLFARQLTISLQKMGVSVFPDFNNCWHFDDKIGQKYLLESINAPLVPTYVFYDKQAAYNWIRKTNFPKVFKLRRGAGSLNVKLARNRRQAMMLTKNAFRRGFSPNSGMRNLRQRLWIVQRDKDFGSLVHFAKGIARLVFRKKTLALLPPEKGYVYFQDYIPNNQYDDRIVVVGNRAFALRRYSRQHDFRASGSGVFQYGQDIFEDEIIAIAFKIADELHTTSLAFDFIYDANHNPQLTEISYAYTMGSAYDNCPGYWDKDLNWHTEDVNPQYFMIEDFLASLR